MKRADYRRQQHNRKKRERELQEKKQHRKETIGYQILLIVMLFLASIVVGLITAWTENPILLMIVWCIIYDILCARNIYNTKRFKVLFVIPAIEVLAGGLLFFLWGNGSPSFVEFIENYDIGLIIIILIFSGLLNGVSCYYYGWLRKKKR